MSRLPLASELRTRWQTLQRILKGPALPDETCAATSTAAEAWRSPVAALPLEPDQRVLCRPHFRRVKDELFFLVSRRPCARLAPLEAPLWDALGSEPTVAELRRRFGEAADAALGRWRELGVCEVVPARWPEGRRRVLVIEPHCDDAVLSVGATMWLRRATCEFHIASIASTSNFTSYYYLDREFFGVDEISALRMAETQLCARLLGGRYTAVGQPEAALRYRAGDWTLDWYRRHRYSISAFIDHRSTDAELAAWTRAVRELFAQVPADEVWIPLGVGPHTDHELARNACLAALTEEPSLLAKREVRLYAEAPYAARGPGYTASVVRALECSGASLVPEPVPITEVISHKLHLASLYGSQFKLAAMRAELEASARLAGARPGELAEGFWRLERAPKLEPLAWYTDADRIRSIAGRLATWSGRHADAGTLRLLLLSPPGRWAQDSELLLHSFPRARFEVYVSPGAAAEVDEVRNPRLRVHHVGGGAKAWLALSLRLALSRPVPTVFCAGWAQLERSRVLARLWVGSDPIVLPTLGHFVTALALTRSGARTAP